MEGPGKRGSAGRGAQRPGRTAADGPLMREVRWRLFRREDLPARLRRLQRLEDIALGEANGRPPDAAPDSPRGEQPS